MYGHRRSHNVDDGSTLITPPCSLPPTRTLSPETFPEPLTRNPTDPYFSPGLLGQIPTRSWLLPHFLRYLSVVNPSARAQIFVLPLPKEIYKSGQHRPYCVNSNYDRRRSSWYESTPTLPGDGTRKRSLLVGIPYSLDPLVLPWGNSDDGRNW